MKRYSLLVVVCLVLTACSFFADPKKEAIEICQKAKVTFQTETIESSFLSFYGITANATWLDFANIVAKRAPNKKYTWQAVPAGDKNVFLVAFVDESNWGQHWEVDVEQKIVKDVNSNDYLSRKYGFSRFDGSTEFKVTDLKENVLKVDDQESLWGSANNKKVVYVIKASILNNSGKTITSVRVEGKLMLIFKDKTIEGESNYNSGFVTGVSENEPWQPNTARDIYIKTTGIDKLYLQYVPEYVLFDVSLKAEDPVGYKFDKDIFEDDLLEKWKMLKVNPVAAVTERPAETALKSDTSIQIDSTPPRVGENDLSDETYVVISPRAYFYNSPDSSSRRKAYLVLGEHFKTIKDINNYVYGEFINPDTKKMTDGWISKADLRVN